MTEREAPAGAPWQPLRRSCPATVPTTRLTGRAAGAGRAPAGGAGLAGGPAAIAASSGRSSTIPPSYPGAPGEGAPRRAPAGPTEPLLLDPVDLQHLGAVLDEVVDAHLVARRQLGDRAQGAPIPVEHLDLDPGLVGHHPGGR